MDYFKESIADGAELYITHTNPAIETVSVLLPVSRHTIEHTNATLLQKAIAKMDHAGPCFCSNAKLYS